MRKPEKKNDPLSGVLQDLRVSFSHDWLINRRGAERVLDVLLQLFPTSRIYTLIVRKDGCSPRVRSHPLTSSSLSFLPGVARYYRYLLPLYPFAIESMKAKDIDLLISVHHSVAKAIPYSGKIPHICYCLSPMRYLWEPALYGKVLNRSWKGTALKGLETRLKKWDLDSNSGVTRFVAVSRTVQKRILKHYSRESTVIYPGADIEFFQSDGRKRGDFYLIVSALVPQKRLDIAVDAFRENGKKLVVAGDGPLRRDLERRAGKRTTFLGPVSDARLRELYSEARALVFPGVEDFGLVPVEAQSACCPVIALRQGGVTETVTEGETGIFYDDPFASSLNKAVTTFESASFDGKRLRENAERFSLDEFQKRWRRFLSKHI